MAHTFQNDDVTSKLNAANLNSLDLGGNVKAGVGLSVDISAVRIRRITLALSDVDVVAGSVAVTANQTNAIWLVPSTGIFTSGIAGFPDYAADQDFVPLAEAVTDGTGVVSLVDKRINLFA